MFWGRLPPPCDVDVADCLEIYFSQRVLPCQIRSFSVKPYKLFESVALNEITTVADCDELQFGSN